MSGPRKPMKRLSDAKREKLGHTPFSTLSRSSGIAKKNATRRQSEWARCYGSKERVAWVKSQGCLVCATISPFFEDATRGTSHNAHTVTGGKGRKADYQTIVPLCASHHRRYDEHRYPLDDPKMREWLKAAASAIDRLWQAHCAARRTTET